MSASAWFTICGRRATRVALGSEKLAAGDAAAVSGAGALDVALDIVGGESSEVLLFDLA